MSVRPGLPRFRVGKICSESDLRNEAQEETNWAESLLGIPDVWWQTQGKGAKVAILDTGVDCNHKDLQAGIIATKDFTGDGIEDTNGHGTHVAGIIGARMNGTGFVGIAPECSLMIGKVLGNDSSGSYDWISDGVRWATDNGAHIINMSLGGPDSSPNLFEAIHYALMKGVIICCAAGNDGALFQNSIGYPGKYGGVITVASHDWNGRISGFSSRGGEVDFMAPGHDIWSTYMDGQYATLSGTSMSSPFVAGLCALILAKHMDTEDNDTPIFNTEDMRQHLMWMASHAGWHDPDEGYGALLPFSPMGEFASSTARRRR
jgi:subtilisin family serine protease